MDKYRKVVKPKGEKDTKDEKEVRCTAVGSVSTYVSRAAKVLNEMKEPYILITGSGNAITKAVQLAEVVKRRIAGLHQISKLGVTEIVDEYEPLEEGLDKVTDVRQVATIEIKLSTTALDTNDPGYQAPLDPSEVKEITAEELTKPRGRGKGSSPGKGKGKGADKGTGKGKGKGKDNAKATAKGSSKGLSKGKSKGTVETGGKGKDTGKGTSKSKGKDDSKAKGKGKGKDDSKGKGKGKDSSKGRDKSRDYYDSSYDYPPTRSTGKGSSSWNTSSSGGWQDNSGWKSGGGWDDYGSRSYGSDNKSKNWGYDQSQSRGWGSYW